MFCTYGQISSSLLVFTSFYLPSSIAVIAYDTQIYGSCSPSHVDDLSSTLSRCVNDVADWMQTNRFQLNPGKMELLWCTTSRRQKRLPTATLTVGSTIVSPVSSVHDLGIFINSDLVMRTHMCQTVSRCLAALRQLRSVHHLVSATVFESLVTTLVLSRLDYGNGMLVSLPTHLIRRFQSVQNAAAWLIFRLRPWPHHGRAHQLTLVTSARKDRVQGRSADLLGTARWCPSVPSAVYISRRHPVPTKTWSSTSDDLCIPAVRLHTVGRRAFSVAGVCVWNALPADVTSAPSLFTFQKRLKLHLFHFPIVALSSKLIFI